MKLKVKFKAFSFILLILMVFCLFHFISLDISFKELNEGNSNESCCTFDLPKTQAFDYEPLINEQIHGKGNISIIKLETNRRGFLVRDKYPEVTPDIISGDITPRDNQSTLIKTTKPANFNLIDSRENFVLISVQYNDSIYFDYTENATSDKIIYMNHLYPSNLIRVYLNSTELPEDNYTVDSEGVFIYYYREHHAAANGTLHFSFIYDYLINLEDWEITQFPNQDLYMLDTTQELSVKYRYKFEMSAYSRARLTGDVQYASELTLYFQFCIQESELLKSFSYEIGGASQSVNDYKNSKNWFNGSLSGNKTEVALNFTADFEVKFQDVCHDFWAVDRLIWMNNIRERIYFLSITDGPSSLNIENIQFNELNIYSGQFLDIRTNFERAPEIYDLNLTGGGGLPATPGLKISAPYFIKNEVLAVIVEYFTNDSLSILVTDQVLNPVEGVILKFYYYNQTYGTYISSIKSQPIPDKITDSAGQVSLEHVPKGIYRVDVYNILNQFIINGTADTSINLNYINTPIPHIPTTIIFFSVLYSIILLIGIWIFLKYRDID